MENKHYERKVFYSKEDDGWVAVVPEVPGCSAFGRTAVAALKELDLALSLWLESAQEVGISIPPPAADRDLKGRILLRVPKSLHRELVIEAGSEGVSLNQHILYVLSSAHRTVADRAVPRYRVRRKR